MRQILRRPRLSIRSKPASLNNGAAEGALALGGRPPFLIYPFQCARPLQGGGEIARMERFQARFGIDGQKTSLPKGILQFTC